MGDWPNANLGDLASSEAGSIAIGPFGSRMKADVYVDAGVPVIRGTNISSDRSWKGEWVYITDDFADTMPNCNVVQDDLVFPHRGSIGEVAIVPGDAPRYMLSTSLMKFRANTQKLNPLFAFYFFRSGIGRSEILKFSSQVGTPGIGQPLTSLRQFKVPLPPLGVQTDIADFLAALDDKIELNRRMNETLEAMARAIFKDWFVEFRPTRAKAEGRPPYLAPDLWSLFPSALDDADKPVGWREASIYEFADVIYGAPFASSQFNTQGIGEPLLRIRDLIKESPGVWTNELHPKGYKVRAGDIVVGMDGEFRSYLWGGAAAWLNQRLCVFAPKQGCSAAFVRNSIVEPLARVEATETATTVIHLGKSDIDRFLLIAPTDKVLAVFNSLCQPLYDRIIVTKRESRTLAQTRDLLLPKLMSGEIRLREAEKAVEAVA